ncbi:MAG TPA: hypothetical protein VG602_08340 [Actinomycetota bacterium]|nr:hypothetical protein [Actinomycetota bacterium]
MGKKRRALMGTILGLAVSWSGVAPATGQLDEDSGDAGGDNAVVLVNTKDGFSAFRLSFRVLRVNQDVVDQANAAVAFSSCEGCRTVAVAVQVLLVFSDPSVVSPTNLAIAMNFECFDCDTLASAYQFVLGTDGVVRFSAEGNQAIARIRQALRDLLQAELSLEETQAQLDQLAAELQSVLANELVAAGAPDVRVEEIGTPSSPEPTEEPSPQPTQSPDDRSTPTPAADEPSPSPSPEAEASPTPVPSSSPSGPTPAETVSPAY